MAITQSDYRQESLECLQRFTEGLSPLKREAYKAGKRARVRLVSLSGFRPLLHYSISKEIELCERRFRVLNQAMEDALSIVAQIQTGDNPVLLLPRLQWYAEWIEQAGQEDPGRVSLELLRLVWRAVALLGQSQAAA